MDNLSFGSIVKFVMNLGVLPIIALYLIWSATERSQKQLDAMTAQLTQQNLSLQELRLAGERQANQNDLMIDLARQLCINAGRTYEDRAACWTLNGRGAAPR